MATPLPIVRAPAAANAAAGPIVGIDLGTTFSLAAWLGPDGQPTMVRDAAGEARVPSALAFGKHGEVAVGWAARQLAAIDPERVVYSVKRLIGRTLADLKEDMAFVPYQVVERDFPGGRKALHVRVGSREHTPEELSAMILRDLAARASAALGQPVRRAVITVPAYFDDTQRQATRDAGRIAGLDVVRIVNEPTAAALAYGLHERKEGRIAVYDLGGGTFDCSVLELADGVFRVLSTHGDTRLGGDDFDLALLKRFEPELAAAGGPLDAACRQRLRAACERLKIALSSAETADLAVELPGAAPFRRTCTRTEFEALTEPLVERTLASCRAALADAGLAAADVDEVVLVGGSSRLPAVRRQVAELFGRTPHTELNPDEVVALGAAVQAGILAGQLKSALLLDIAPLSLGLETIGGAVSRLIPRNSAIPARATERFSTFADGQTAVALNVVQGERELARDCRSLGRFTLAGLPPMPAGLPQLDVTFLLDANGLLQVTAVEQRSGKALAVEVRPSHGLDRSEVERLIAESVANAAADHAARRWIDLAAKADENLRHVAKALARAGDRADRGLRDRIAAAAAAAEGARMGSDAAALQLALDGLDAAARPLAELLMNEALRAEVAGRRLEGA